MFTLLLYKNRINNWDIKIKIKFPIQILGTFDNKAHSIRYYLFVLNAHLHKFYILSYKFCSIAFSSDIVFKIKVTIQEIRLKIFE